PDRRRKCCGSYRSAPGCGQTWRGERCSSALSVSADERSRDAALSERHELDGEEFDRWGGGAVRRGRAGVYVKHLFLRLARPAPEDSGGGQQGGGARDNPTKQDFFVQMQDLVAAYKAIPLVGQESGIPSEPAVSIMRPRPAASRLRSTPQGLTLTLAPGGGAALDKGSYF